MISNIVIITIGGHCNKWETLQYAPWTVSLKEIIYWYGKTHALQIKSGFFVNRVSMQKYFAKNTNFIPIEWLYEVNMVRKLRKTRTFHFKMSYAVYLLPIFRLPQLFLRKVWTFLKNKKLILHELVYFSNYNIMYINNNK